MAKGEVTGNDQGPLEHMVPHTGRNLSGMPLTLNRRPAPDLDPWVARMVAAKIEIPRSIRIECGMFNDLAFIRTPLGGDWSARTADGSTRFKHRPVLFGPHSRYMPVICEGEIYSAGIGLRPGTLHGLFGLNTVDVVDRILPVEQFSLVQDEFADLFSAADSPDAWLRQLEDALRLHIDEFKVPPPDPITTAFDHAAFADPNMSVTDYAEEHGLGMKRLERIIKRDFGLPPKQVLTRARVLDLASQLCGVSDVEEEAELLLRYSDQSHQIKEFTAYFGMTPSQFRAHPKPLITLNLEARQARRLEELERLDPNGPRPWRED